MPQRRSKNWKLPARLLIKRDMVGVVFCFGKKMAEEQFFKKWLGIYKFFSSLSSLRDQIGVKS
jgi:hypothetical protein